MAYAEHAKLNEDPCPVEEDLLGQLHRAAPPDAVEIAKSLDEPQRAELAAFCYARRHLHALGLMIASTCDKASLMAASPNAGNTIYDQSRDPERTLAKGAHRASYGPPKLITLAGSATD